MRAVPRLAFFIAQKFDFRSAMDDRNWKNAALRARGDYISMLVLCGAISSSDQAAHEQVEAAKAAKTVIGFGSQNPIIAEG